MERRKARRLTLNTNKSWQSTDRNQIKCTGIQEKSQTNTGISTETLKPAACTPAAARSAGGTGAGALRGQDSSQGLGSGEAGLTLRRGRRSYAEGLVQQAAWLAPVDRALIEAVYGNGLSVAAYVRRCRDRGVPPAAEMGSEASAARSARRRLRRLIERVSSDRFKFVTARRNTWPTTRRRVALSCVVHGLSLRDASASLGLSLHTVRRHMEAVDALFTEFVFDGRRASSGLARKGDGSWRA